MVTNILTLLLMRRSLALSNEAARHPFRASLPPHVLRVPEEITPVFEPEVVAAIAARQTAAQITPQAPEAGEDGFWSLTAKDMRGFASVYLATFLAVLVFIM